jgi:hypothetical protein
MSLSGNEIDHLAHRAHAEGRVDTLWLALRDACFREGTLDQAWARMEAAFGARGCFVSSVECPDRGGTWVVLRPLR